MSIRYSIEIWNLLTSRYETVWSGTEEYYANRMMNKPYIMRYTRKLIKTTEEELDSAKADKYTKRR